MSALDPSAPGLPLAGGVGGGASLPTTPALALLDAGNPNVLVGLDADGVGVAVPPSASGATVLTGDATAGREALGAAATLPISAQGDLVIGDAMGAPSRFAKGTDGKFLKSSATSLMWDDPPSPLPTTLAGALLDVPNADKIVVLDEFGVGAAVTGAQLGVAIGLPWSSSATPVTVQTTDATQTTLATFATATDKGHTIVVVTQATKSDRSTCTSWMHILSATNAAGTVTIRNTLQIALDDPGTAYAVAFDVSTTNVRVRVTGAAATTLDWSASVIAITGGS